MNNRNTHRSNTYDFIKKAREKHGDKYDYSKVEYINNKTKVCIICPEHGEFWQTPNTHLRGRGCPFCSKMKNTEMLRKNGDLQRLTTQEFIRRAQKVHGIKYDYSKVKYMNNYTGIEIVCTKHGSFYQTPSSHLCGCGCLKCAYENQRNSKHDFIEKNKKALKCGINIIYFRYGKIDIGDFPYNVIFNEDTLLDILKKED